MIGQYFIQESIYRPYHWGKYTIKNILFYDNNGVVDSIGHGWVEHDGRDLKYIKLDNAYSPENHFTGVRTYEDDIETILTHEQYEQNCYKIERN